MRRSVQTAAVAHGLAGQALGTLQHSPTQARHNSPPSLKISARSAVKLRSLWNFALYLGPLGSRASRLADRRTGNVSTGSTGPHLEGNCVKGAAAMSRNRKSKKRPSARSVVHWDGRSAPTARDDAETWDGG